MNYKAIIFDVSDTLVEYSPNWAQFFSNKLRSLGFDITEEQTFAIDTAVKWACGEQTKREQNGAPPATIEQLYQLMDEAALSCVPHPSERKDEYLEAMARIAMPKQKLSVIDGVFPMLDTLRMKYRLAIVSNHYSWLMDYLKESKLHPYFESIIISELVGVEKPDIRIMDFVLQDLKLSPQHCLYVGDHPLDVQCAKQAGMNCAWISRPDVRLHESIPYQEDYKITKVTELLSIL